MILPTTWENAHVLRSLRAGDSDHDKQSARTECVSADSDPTLRSDLTSGRSMAPVGMAIAQLGLTMLSSAHFLPGWEGPCADETCRLRVMGKAGGGSWACNLLSALVSY